MCEFARIQHTRCRHVVKQVNVCHRAQVEPMDCTRAHAQKYILDKKCVGCQRKDIDKTLVDLGLLEENDMGEQNQTDGGIAALYT